MNTLIIPAYNESRYIPHVLSVVTGMPDFKEVIVVDDGSTDQTALIAARYAVRVIRLEQNRGKGGAIAAGLETCETPFLTFLDADLIGLLPEHIRALTKPVLEDRYAMALGLFASGRKRTDWAQKLVPSITGQRVVRRELLQNLPDLGSTRFGVDLAITNHIKRMQLPIAEVIMHNVTQQMKEEKLGLARGMAARLKMYWEILRVMGR